jgi:hypothetical protein
MRSRALGGRSKARAGTFDKPPTRTLASRALKRVDRRGTIDASMRRCRALALVSGTILAAPLACGRFLPADGSESDGGNASMSASDASLSESNTAEGSSLASCIAPADAKTFFCRTFDETGLASPYGFDEIDEPAQATVALVDAPQRSGKGLRLTLAQGDFERGFGVVKELGGLSGRYQLDFDVYVVSSTLTYGAIGALRFLASGYAAFPGVAQYDSARFASKLAPYANQIPFPTATWHHVRVEASFVGGLLTSTILVDGRVAGNVDLTQTAPANTTASLKLGYFFTGDEPGAMEVIIDDLVAIVR